MRVQLAVVYYSTYGTNYQIASIAAEAGKAAGAQVRLLKVAETAPAAVVEGQAAWKAQADAMAHIPTASAADMAWANAYLFCAPTRFGGMATGIVASACSSRRIRRSVGSRRTPPIVFTPIEEPHSPH